LTTCAKSGGWRKKKFLALGEVRAPRGGRRATAGRQLAVQWSVVGCQPAVD
jgi:hypothetical protein